MGTGARVSLFNLWILTCVLPWQGAGVWSQVVVAVSGLVLFAVALYWAARPVSDRVLGVVAVYLLAATLRPWPAWSWLVLLGSAAAALLFGLMPAPTFQSLGGDGMVDAARSGTPAPARWRRRMLVTRVLAIGGAGGAIALLLAANVAEIGLAGRPAATALLLTGGAGLLGLFALRQFFWLPAIEHIAEDSGVRARVARSRSRSRSATWGRVALFLAMALLGLFLASKRGG